jgi:hypothetical protein
MDQPTFAAFMDRIYETEIKAVRADGQAEYAGKGQSAFANFERLANDLNLTPEKVLWVYAMKHRDGIANYLNGHTSQREDVTGRIKDLIVYLFLLWGLVEQGRIPGIPDSEDLGLLQRSAADVIDDWVEKAESPEALHRRGLHGYRLADVVRAGYRLEDVVRALDMDDEEFVQRIKGGHIDDPPLADEGMSL